MSGHTPRGGEFATSQRGGLSQAEIREIEAHRAKERPTPWNALAKRYGRCEADIRALFDPKASNDDAVIPEPGPFLWTEDAKRQLKVAYIDLDMSAEATAELLGCAPVSVVRKAARLGLSKRKRAA